MATDPGKDPPLSKDRGRESLSRNEGYCSAETSTDPMQLPSLKTSSRGASFEKKEEGQGEDSSFDSMVSEREKQQQGSKAAGGNGQKQEMESGEVTAGKGKHGQKMDEEIGQDTKKLEKSSGEESSITMSSDKNQTSKQSQLEEGDAKGTGGQENVTSDSNPSQAHGVEQPDTARSKGVCCEGCEDSLADLECHECGMKFCTPCFKKEHLFGNYTMHKPECLAQEFEEDSLLRCERCKLQKAAISCVECGMEICMECNKLLHSKGKRKEHQRTRYTSEPGANHTRFPNTTEGPTFDPTKDRLMKGWSTSSCNIHHLLKVVDQVEATETSKQKVELDEEAALQLASTFSAQPIQGRTDVDFEVLNSKPIRTIGLLGNMEKLCDWLVERGVVSHTSADKLSHSEPGIHSLTCPECPQLQFLVFYPQLNCWSNMAEHNSSCNLIRCLFELSSSVVVFYSADQALTGFDIPFFKRSSNRNMYAPAFFEVDKEEEEVSISPGFKADIPETVLKRVQVAGMSTQFIALHGQSEVGPDELELIPKRKSTSAWQSANEVRSTLSHLRQHYKIEFHTDLTKTDHFWQFLAKVYGNKCTELNEVAKHRKEKSKADALSKLLSTSSVFYSILGYICSECPVAKLFLDEVCSVSDLEPNSLGHVNLPSSAQTEDGTKEEFPSALRTQKEDVQKRDDQYRDKFREASSLLDQYLPKMHFQEILSPLLPYLQAMETMCFFTLLARKEKWQSFEKKVKREEDFPGWAEGLFNEALEKQAFSSRQAAFSFVSEWLKKNAEPCLKKNTLTRSQSFEKLFRQRHDQFLQRPFEHGIAELLLLKSCRNNVKQHFVRLTEKMTACLEKERSQLPQWLAADKLQSKEKKVLDAFKSSFCSCTAEDTKRPPCLAVTEVCIKLGGGFNLGVFHTGGSEKFQLVCEEQYHSQQTIAERLYLYDFKPATVPQDGAKRCLQLADYGHCTQLLWLPENSHVLKVWLLTSGQVLFILHVADTSRICLAEKQSSEWKFLPLDRAVIGPKPNQICCNEEVNMVAFLFETTKEFFVFQFNPKWTSSKLRCHNKVPYHHNSSKVYMLLSNWSKLLFLYTDGHLVTWNIKRNSEATSLSPLSIEDGSPITHALLSLDGYFIFALTTAGPKYQSPMSQKHQGDPRQHSAGQIRAGPTSNAEEEGIHRMFVYSVSKHKLVKSYDLTEYNFTPSIRQSLSFVQLGNDLHLVALDEEYPKQSLLLCKVHIGPPADSSNVSVEKKTSLELERSQIKVCSNYLDYLCRIYDQFCIIDCLKSVRTSLFLTCLVDLTDIPTVRELSQKARRYVNDCFQHISSEMGKPIDDFTWKVQLDSLSSSCQKPLSQFDCQSLKWFAGEWMRHLICLVPIQICRADLNHLIIQPDGRPINFEVFGSTKKTADVQKVISFGLFDTIFRWWSRPVMVVSSMGEQSTGKSYLLNHLTGSMFDMAIGQCTNGIWMAVRITKDCLVVALDFEGIVSAGNSTQEDTLLCITQAAISGLTLFRTNYNAHASMPELFERCYVGTNLIKGRGAARFFRGFLWVCPRDVQPQHTDEVVDYYKKYFLKQKKKELQIFLQTLYGGKLQVQNFPHPNKRNFYEQLDVLGQCLKKPEMPFFQSGREFIHDFTLLLAKVSCFDWTNVEQDAETETMDILCYHMVEAISIGQQRSETGEICDLLLWTNSKPVEDNALRWKDGSPLTDLPDAGTQLCLVNRRHDDETTAPVLLPLQLEESNLLMKLLGLYEDKHGKRHIGGSEKLDGWIKGFQKLLEDVCKRRVERVLKWMSSHSQGLLHCPRISKYEKSVEEVLRKGLQRLWVLSCTSKCKHCSHGCLRLEHADSNHDCLGDHKCFQQCNQETCSAKAEEKRCDKHYGHADEIHSHQDLQHKCKKCLNTCTDDCNYPPCMQKCSKVVNHTDSEDQDHRCRSHARSCGERCSLQEPYCGQMCTVPLSEDNKAHSGRHACSDRQCRSECELCDRRCNVRDHFHGIGTTAVKHLCGNKHRCKEPCGSPGHCDIVQTSTVEDISVEQPGGGIGMANTRVSVQKGVRKKCGKWIDENDTHHREPHVCDHNINFVHLCGEECRGCGYLCDLPHGHDGRHQTEHGNMRLSVAVTANFTHSFTFNGRTYQTGQPGNLEMCALYCEGKGRGHMHLIECSAQSAAECPSSKLSLSAYGQDVDAMEQSITHVTLNNGSGQTKNYDKLSHYAYWKKLGFKDPCNGPNDFGYCSTRCPVTEHDTKDEESYCALPVCHKPIQYSEIDRHHGGFIHGGHYFTCEHQGMIPLHHVFVVDISTSMGVKDYDLKPLEEGILFEANDNRLGVVLQACSECVANRRQCGEHDTVSLISFGTKAEIKMKNEPLNPERFQEACLSLQPTDPDTNFYEALKVTGEVISFAEANDETNRRRCVVVFLTDGRNTTGAMEDAKKYLGRILKNRDNKGKPKVRFHFYEFGSGRTGYFNGWWFTGVQPLYETAQEFAAGDAFAKSTFTSATNVAEVAMELEQLSSRRNPLIADFVVKV